MKLSIANQSRLVEVPLRGLLSASSSSRNLAERKDVLTKVFIPHPYCRFSRDNIVASGGDYNLLEKSYRYNKNASPASEPRHPDSLPAPQPAK
eukprot:6214634-Pleurochrysis_carterae.AAC.2